MTLRERIRYHSVHPARLAAIAVGGPLVLFFLWRQETLAAAFSAALPLGIGFYLVSKADLERCRRSALGRYVTRFITPSAQARIAAGWTLMLWSAWHRNGALLIIGASLVIHAWTAGILIPREAAARRRS